MSSPSTPVGTFSDNEIVPESLLATSPKSPGFMFASADSTAKIEGSTIETKERIAAIESSEEFDFYEDEFETIEEKSGSSDAKSQFTTTLHVPAEVRDEVTALHLRLGQDEQRIAELEQQIATMKGNKREWKENHGESSGQQQRKRRKTVKVNTAGPVVKKSYMGKKPHCNRCNRHHTGHCGIRCGKCKMYGHSTKDCRSIAPTVKLAATPRASEACYECGGIGHFRKDCANLKNGNKNTNNSTGGIN